MTSKSELRALLSFRGCGVVVSSSSHVFPRPTSNKQCRRVGGRRAELINCTLVEFYVLKSVEKLISKDDECSFWAHGRYG